MDVTYYLLFIIAIVIVIIVLLVSSKTKIIEGSELYDSDTDKAYRNCIYRNIEPSSKSYLNEIFQSIDEINRLINISNSQISQATYDAMHNIFNHANKVESQIQQCWNNNKFKKNFSYYIGLHYASYLLGNAIKSEQLKVRDAFVAQKNNRELWGKKIDSLKSQQYNCSNAMRGRIGKEIADACRVHKQISTLASQIGEINSKYNARVTKQHIKTAKRRDFIAQSFGERGQKWKSRLRQRAIFRENNLKKTG